MDNLLKEKKVTKSKFIYNVLIQKKDFSLESYNCNFFTDEIHREYGIKPTKNISSHKITLKIPIIAMVWNIVNLEKIITPQFSIIGNFNVGLCEQI